MQVIQNHSNCPPSAKQSVIALGNFDGVHKGHQEIIKLTCEIARAKNLPSAVMTFEPHPVSVFRPEISNFHLTSLEQKIKLIEALGVDFLFVMNFDENFAKITAEDFIKNILCEGLSVKHVVIGYDFIFGHDRGGNAQMLHDLSGSSGYGFTQVDAVGKDDMVFSSTKIRENLRQGNLENVQLMLGRNYEIAGVVIKGENRGKGLGFPTINIDSGELMRPASGVYAVRVKIGDAIYNGVANIGTKPTFVGKTEELEVHIFDFDEDVYGRNVEIEFIQYIRAEEKFQSVESLVAQIAKDCIKAREILQ
jgi:riboflavin kinase/FMN adenylyltransferase